MPAPLLVPFVDGGRLVHFLDDVPPTDTGVVGAEGDLAFLGGVGDDALLGTAEVVVEQILEPHPGDEEEVPTVGPSLLDVRQGAIAGDLAVIPTGYVVGLVELLEEGFEREVGRSLEGI